jgi:ubiquinone/menaquinone biosynthesis C-methylase UbiE
MVWIILVLAVVAAVIFIFIEIEVKRKVSFEGIEDESVVKAYDYMSRSPQFRAMRAIFVRELKKIGPNGTLADVGCGPGYLLGVLARNLPQLKLVGVDISAEIIAQARANLSSFPNVDFKIAGVQGLPFEDNSVDFVVSTLSLHHWSRPSESLREFYRVLKPGGHFLVFDLRRNPPILAHFVIRLGTAMIVPGALRRMKEPLGSLLASYTPAEVKSILKDIPITRFKISKGFFWLFLWGKKSDKEKK